ncbi:aspartate aminotransferase family protein [Salinactinospora qingdaonensis]|uniref:Glutamate-1-semialdehyde 2,1-aminomutase n=1 Tax=Salinactinospora qingdaonensis TaxID=702744 RepID=A0ABP7FKN8_9ACTN
MKVNAHYQSARRVLPGGVSATARANPALGHPLYISRGEGARVYDLDGQDYVDMCVSHGASLLGHNHPAITAAVAKALDMGIICAYENEHQAQLAETLTEVIPCAEMVRFAGTGTETVMHALRLARTATGRRTIIKFEGHFNGYSDALNYSVAPPLDQAGPAERPRPYPESAGMAEDPTPELVILPFNDADALTTAFAERGDEVAALFMEPINYDSGTIPPEPGFVELCRRLCDQHGALLFFDEVLTAFRMALGGAQGHLGVTPDLCVLGKAIGGGMPLSALVGTRAVMSHLRPVGESEMSGTYLAHSTSVLAAQAAVEQYRAPEFYSQLTARGARFYADFQSLIDASDVPVRLQHVGARFGLYFGRTEPVRNYRDAAQQDPAMLATFVAGCIRRGVYVHPAAHHGFSSVHTDADFDRVLTAIDGALRDVADTHMLKGASR